VDSSGKPTAVTLATLKTSINRGAAPASTDRVQSSFYDVAGRLVATVTPVGAVTKYFYDGLDRLTDEIQYAVLGSGNTFAARALALTAAAIPPVTPSAADRRTRNFYDGDSHLVGRLDGAGYLTEYSYDGAGRLVSQVTYATQSDPTI